MEGVITCAVAIFAYSFLIKFPDEEREKPSWRFLEADETEFLINRLNADRNDAEPEKFTWKRFLQPATEWYIYGFPFILLYMNPKIPPSHKLTSSSVSSLRSLTPSPSPYPSSSATTSGSLSLCLKCSVLHLISPPVSSCTSPPGIPTARRHVVPFSASSAWCPSLAYQSWVSSRTLGCSTSGSLSPLPAQILLFRA